MKPDTLNQSFHLTSEQIAFYQKHKYIKLKQVLDPETISNFNQVITRQVEAMKTVEIPLEERDTYGQAFLQLFNLWRENEEIKKLVFSQRIARIATELMQVEGVRIYHDQALYKESGGGITPWHADQYYWPLATNNTITAWIPLQRTPLEMGPLEFSAGSHVIQEGRDLEISAKSEAILDKKLRITDFQHVIEPYDIGEVSFHSGWVFHRAGANQSVQTRKVMTVIYMDQDTRLMDPVNDNQRNDWEKWCPGAIIDQVIDTELNPILYSQSVDSLAIGA